MKTKMALPCFCEVNDRHTPPGYYLDSTGTYDLSYLSVPKKRISKTPVWIELVKQDVRTLKSEAMLAYVTPDLEMHYIEVPSETFLSFERMRSRVLSQTAIEVEGWSLNAFLRYLRMAELLCPNLMLIGLGEDDLSTVEVQNVC
jgi:hypothetical protein